MSVTAAKAGLKVRLETLKPTHVRTVLNGMPATAHNMPLAYLELRDGSRTPSAAVTANRYRIAVCVLVAFQDNMLAEDQIDALVNVVADAIDQAPTLPSGASSQVTFATGRDWDADYFTIGDVLTRRLTWIVEVTDKGTRRSGI